MALGLLGLSAAAQAQSIPRIKAVVIGFDGNALTVMPDGESKSMKIGVRPATRILQEEQKPGGIQEGDYVGATLTRSSMGVFEAQEVHVFPPALKGSGEGLYPLGGNANRFVLNGTVTNAAATTLAIKFRGASGDGPKCTGRAPVDKPLNGCQGNATIAVPASAPVVALMPGDKSLLVPGAVLAISIIAGPDGKPVTPGLTVESLTSQGAPSRPAHGPAGKRL